MHGLHQIIPNTTKHIWFYAINGRGHIVGTRGWANRRFVPAHLYAVERGTPPPLGNNARRHWQPYMANAGNTWVHHPEWLRPICGPIKTASQFVHAAPASDRWDQFMRCPNCVQLAGRGETHESAIENDPWFNIDWFQRTNTPDPISGV